MAALVDVPRTFLSHVWGQARSSSILPFLRGARMAANTTVENTAASLATEVPQAAASSSPVMKGFFDPSNVYTSGYALGVAIMVRQYATDCAAFPC